MSDIKHQDLKDLRAELESSDKYDKPEPGKPVLGYLGDLGHTYARPDQLTKEALFGMNDAPPLVQTEEQKKRARDYEVQAATDNFIMSTASGIQGLASRLISKLLPEKESHSNSSTFKPK